MSKERFDQGGSSLANAVKALYLEGQADYSLEPLVFSDARGFPIGRVSDGDSVIFCCRRGEREVEITEAFVERDFDKFPRGHFKKLDFVTLTLYHEKFKDLPVAFAPEIAHGTLGEAVSKAGCRQLRVSESEKFAHITFFLNMGKKNSYANEEDSCIASPKGIAYDQIPELSLGQVTRQVIGGLEKQYDLIVTNFANGDVIGHTANQDAKIKCAAYIDRGLEEVVNAALQSNYTVLITADHGNLEMMTHLDGTPHAAHTDNLVPFIFIDPHEELTSHLTEGILADISPTILSLMGIPKPDEMTGISLIPQQTSGRRKVLLIILDGWGIGKPDDANPIYLAETPFWDYLLHRYPNTRLKASGVAVGLQAGKAGNSEAGHMNIGAGRIVLQDDVRLDMAINNGTFDSNPVFLQTIQKVKQNKSALHLIGLLSEKSSHGSIEYPLALLRLAKTYGLEKVYLHIIFDGRSTEPGSAPAMLEKLEHQIGEIGVGKIVTGIGRGIALDRNGDYGKIKQAYDALVFGTGRKFCLVEQG